LSGRVVNRFGAVVQGRVRRARIYYLRGLSGKAARISERKAALVPVENTDTTK